MRDFIGLVGEVFSPSSDVLSGLPSSDSTVEQLRQLRRKNSFSRLMDHLRERNDLLKIEMSRMFELLIANELLDSTEIAHIQSIIDQPEGDLLAIENDADPSMPDGDEPPSQELLDLQQAAQEWRTQNGNHGPVQSRDGDRSSGG